MGSLEGRVALITGAGDGTGRQHALLMAERGADVAVVDMHRPGAEETAAGIREQGRRAEVFELDVSDVEAIGSVVAQAEDRLGSIDILVNNAGHGQRSALADISEADFITGQVLSVNGGQVIVGI